MVGLVDGGLFDLAHVQPQQKTPAKARKHFEVPRELPRDYAPPEYRSIDGLKRIGLDIEAHDPGIDQFGPGAHRKDGKVVGVSIAYAEQDACYYPTQHEVGPNVEDPDKFYARLAEEAQKFEGEIVGANLQYDLDWLRTRHGIVFPKAKFRDVQIAEPLIDENRLTYKLDALCKDYLNLTKSYDELVKLYGQGYIENMHRVHPSHASVYAEDDATLAWRVFDKQQSKLEQDELLELFRIEAALTPLLLEMRYQGVRVNVKKAEDSSDRLRKEKAEIEAKLRDMAGTSVDIWSADSISVGFDALGLEYERTATGKPSFKKDWLKACNHEIAQLIMRAREYDKTAGTFIDSYILQGHVGGRIHCMFNQLKSDESGTVSGRFSSSNPNLQNIPARHPELGPLMRSMFIPEEGMQWGSLDWSQIEYRLLVHYAASTKGIDASEAVRMYRQDPSTDFHQMASDLTGVPRKQAKNVNFGVVYGMGVPKLAASLGVEMSDAQAIMDKFHANAPFIRSMLERASSAAASRGFIRTILGRKRRFPTFEVEYRGDKGEVVKELVDEKLLDAVLSTRRVTKRPRRSFTHKSLNALLQGSAADLMKKAMVDAWDAGVFNVLVPHLTVHDELNSSVPRTKEGHEAFEELRHIMEQAVTLEVPVLADGTLGSNWDEAK